MISDSHQTKMEVLTILASPTHRNGSHLHGTQLVTGYAEYGGERPVLVTDNRKTPGNTPGVFI
ncbi:MAG: hypothetical protein ACPHK0_02140 [Dehalococcoidia bacterium]